LTARRQVAHDLLDVLADVADSVNLVASTLMNGAVRQMREAARDLGLADAGRTDHQDVLRRDFLAQRGSSCMRRQRLRSAIATARLAAFWPMM
jgi:hypothetical protein